jgi:hypothetical protein
MINATATISNITVSANLVATQPVGENNLLDIYGGASAAYSLRRLSKNATNVIRVRRSSDNAEANFTAEQILDGDLLRWVGLSASDDGFVTTYFDQSGNGNNAVENTASQQPQLVSGGSIITSNGYTVIQYDGTNDNLSTSLTATGTMLMGGSDGGDFYEVDINGSYDLLASASLTDHPLNESIRVIWSSSLTTAQKTAIESLITYTDWDFSDVTNFSNYWILRSELTDFPLLDVSSGTNFYRAFRQCTSLTSFPLLDVSSGTDFSEAWRLCTSLTSFPLLDVSNGTDFYRTWRDCSSLTSFPLLNVSSGTNFQQAWYGCTSLQTFPAKMFDSVTATNFLSAFSNTNLSSQSIENIVVSIDTAGQINGTLDITGGGNATTATAQTAIDNLRGRGWTVTVPDGYVSALLDVFPGAAAAYSLRQLSVNTTNVVRVRRSSDNAEADFTADEITNSTLLSWVGNTASDNGFVTTWYDQSINNDAIQATAANQPKIVDAGVLVEENGKPAVKFDGTDDFLKNTFSSSISQPTYWFVTHNFHAIPSAFDGVIGNLSTTPEHRLIVNSSLNYTLQSGGGLAYNGYQTNQSLIAYKIHNIDPRFYFNGAEQSISLGTSIGTEALGSILLGGINETSGLTPIQFQEIIIYSSDQSSNRTGIETNINNHYNIYP